MTDFVGFHAWAPPAHLADWADEMDRLAERHRLPLLSEGRQGAEREYGRRGIKAVSFYCEVNTVGAQVWGFVPSEAFESITQEVVGALFADVATAHQAHIARSFNELGHGIIAASEIEGALEFIDWFQYLSPRRCGQWSPELLQSAFSRVDVATDGGRCLWLAGSPINVLDGRSHAANVLGIVLRPLVGRNPQTGAPLRMPWR